MDIAEIGFKADTSSLDKATISLNKLKAAASGVSASASSVTQASVAVASAKTSEARATLAAAQATENASRADIKQAREALKLARAEEQKARALLASAKAAEAVARASAGAGSANMSMFNNAATGGRFGGVSASGVRIGSPGDAPIARDQMPNRFNTGNIAAQFQDIGVTAAMGMNPLTIALQQGTQLSAILNTMENPLKGIAIAFRSILNPVSLLSIGLVGLTAAIIQFTDWTEVARGFLNGLADAIEFLEPAIIPVGAALLAVFGPSIAAAIWSTTVAIGAMGLAALKTGAQIAAAWVMANPVTAIVALTAAITAFSVVAFKPIRDFVNNTIGLFVGMFNGIKTQWDMLPAILGDASIKGANVVIDNFESLINKIIPSVNKLLEKLPPWLGGGKELETIAFDRINNPYAGALDNFNAAIKESVSASMSEDYVGEIAGNVSKAVDMASSKLRSIASGLGSESGGKGKKDPWEELVKGAERRIASLEAERAAIGQTAFETARLKYETDLLNEAQQKNIKLTPEQRSKIEELAGSMARMEDGTRKLKEQFDFLKDTTGGFFNDLRKGLLNGEGLWNSFANAAVNALNRIADKIFEAGVDSLFNGFMSGSSKSSGSSFLGSAFSGLSSLLGFAKGGAFTNGIYSNPTMFQFANGGSFGVMGEAGPEAVMPLHRGSDGSLGVRMEGGNVGGGDVINIDARGAEAGVEEKIRAVMNEVLTLRKDVPNIAVSSVASANKRNPRYLNG